MFPTNYGLFVSLLIGGNNHLIVRNFNVFDWILSMSRCFYLVSCECSLHTANRLKKSSKHKSYTLNQTYTYEFEIIFLVVHYLCALLRVSTCDV